MHFAHNLRRQKYRKHSIANATTRIVVTIIREFRSSVRPKRKDFTTRFKRIAIEASLGA